MRELWQRCVCKGVDRKCVVCCVAWLADGETLVFGHWKQPVVFVARPPRYDADIQLDVEAEELAAHPEDAALLAVASPDWTASVWHAREGRRLHVLRGHRGRVQAVQASAEYIVTGSDDRTARVWRWSGGPALRVITVTGPLQNRALVWLGTRLAIADERGVHFWRTTGAPPATWRHDADLSSPDLNFGRFARPHEYVLLADGRAVLSTPTQLRLEAGRTPAERARLRRVAARL